MIMDKLSEFAEAVALSTGGTGRQLVGNVIDLQVARDLGNGNPVYLVLEVDTTFTSGGAATVVFELSSDSQAAIATDATETIHGTTAAIPKATLVQGYKMVIPLPLEDPAYEQYLGIVANVGTAALTAGAINAFLTLDPPKWKAYTAVTGA